MFKLADFVAPRDNNSIWVYILTHHDHMYHAEVGGRCATCTVMVNDMGVRMGTFSLSFPSHKVVKKMFPMKPVPMLS